MSTIAEQTMQAIHAAGRSTSTPSPTRRRVTTATGPTHPVLTLPDDRASRITALVFQSVLFCAMCLSLLAVIQQATHSSPSDAVVGTGVDDAPPAVFVNAD